jgi:hypothetical protein
MKHRACYTSVVRFAKIRLPTVGKVRIKKSQTAASQTLIVGFGGSSLFGWFY